MRLSRHYLAAPDTDPSTGPTTPRPPAARACPRTPDTAPAAAAATDPPTSSATPAPGRDPTGPAPPDTTDPTTPRPQAHSRPAPARRLRSTSGATSGIQKSPPDANHHSWREGSRASTNARSLPSPRASSRR
jgi:hypothetical protein